MEIDDKNVQTVFQEIKEGLVGGRPRGSGKSVHSQGINGDVNVQMSNEESNYAPPNDLWIDSDSDKDGRIRMDAD
ncbi:hypothetical protein GH714_006359 [Hevea brasiliensis]|uniref:Uncharacterized protein n=1 Tax=Hevea brasiliensis TaxID=3981 RepID=A0A6A6MWT6_HEVBR|nr:hypothetical protein GH714_006359 [Hevea brasiliensis]